MGGSLFVRSARALAMLAVLVLAALASAPAAQGTIGTIQPGDFSVSEGAGCTLNFVYDGVGALAGNVYMGTAAHCVSKVGDSVSSSPYANFGTVAFIGDAGTAATDYAFILVKPEFERYVKAAVKGHPEYPTGVTASGETAIGDLVQLSGYGMGFGETYPTQEKRVGVMNYDDTPVQYQVIAPLIYGDSGGPVVHVPTGKALGIVSRLCVAWTCTEFGPTVEGILAQAAAEGFTVELRAA